MIIVLVVGGCGRRAANSVVISQVVDHEKPCESLKVEMNQQQQEISRLTRKGKKAVGNTLLGGFGLISPIV